MNPCAIRIKNPVLIVIIILAVFILISGMVSCKSRVIDRFEETREMMGTYVTIIIYTGQDQSAEILNSAFARIQEISDIASVYDENSQMSELNREGIIRGPSKELTELINLSIEYYGISGGSFDITISPVLELWRQGLWKESEEVQEEKLQEALKLVGSHMIMVEDSGIYFTTEGMSADLGGIAKGYAVDEALKVISDYGVESALVNAGGDVGTIGSRANGEKWMVELDDPDDSGNEDSGSDSLPSFEFEDMAVATSGNYYRYYDPERQVHHITDPHTGYSANSCISATVIAESCIEADVLATAVFVKGPREGMNLIEEIDGVEALIIDSSGRIYQSSGLLKYIK